MPAERAASGLKPTARTSKPVRVRFEDHPEHERHRERDEEADMQALKLRIAPEHRQLGVLHDVVRHGHRRVGVALQRAAEAEQEQARVQIAIQLSMIVEITSLAPVVARSSAGDARPTPRRPEQAATIASRMCSTPGMTANDEPTQTAKYDADEVLALAADVEQAAAERERDREAGEDQRRGHDQRLLKVQRRRRPGRLRSIHGKNQFRPVPSKIALYVLIGLWPVARTTSPPIEEREHAR